MEFDFCAKHEKFIIYGLNPIDEVARLEGLEVNGRLSSVFLGSTTGSRLIIWDPLQNCNIILSLSLETSFYVHTSHPSMQGIAKGLVGLVVTRAPVAPQVLGSTPYGSGFLRI
jgi:hypothetical protein